MKARKILITGATGMLGSRILSTLLQNKRNLELFAIGRSGVGSNFIKCDITDTLSFKKVLEELRPDYVVHCAANVSLDNCEKDKASAYSLHVTASRIIASNKHINKSIFISTDSVFDGISGHYKEDDYVAPLNYYALTKALAEESFFNARHSNIVLRTNIFGFNQPLRNSLFEWAWKNLNENNAISGYNNVFFNPLYVGTVAKIVSNLLELDETTGILHIGTSEGLSKYTFINKIASLFKFPSSLVHSSLAENSSPIRRPMNTILNTDKIQQDYNILMPGIDEELLALFNDFKYN